MEQNSSLLCSLSWAEDQIPSLRPCRTQMAPVAYRTEQTCCLPCRNSRNILKRLPTAPNYARSQRPEATVKRQFDNEQGYSEGENYNCLSSKTSKCRESHNTRPLTITVTVLTQLVRYCRPAEPETKQGTGQHWINPKSLLVPLQFRYTDQGALSDAWSWIARAQRTISGGEQNPTTTWAKSPASKPARASMTELMLQARTKLPWLHLHTITFSTTHQMVQNRDGAARGS